MTEQPMDAVALVLANKNYSSWSLRAWLALKQAGTPFEEIVIPLRQPDTAARILEHSPSGLVPALRIGDVTVWDSLAIIEVTAECYPQAGLWPEEASARALARSVCAEMHSGFAPLRMNMPMNIRASKPGRRRTPEVEANIARIGTIWRHCRGRFGQGGPFLFGAFSAADAFYAPVVSRFVTYGVDLDEVGQAYVKSVMDWPAMIEWCEAGRAEPWHIEDYDAV